MNNKKTHSLTVYLIKESIVDESLIINEGLIEKEILDVGKLFYKASHQNSPNWTKLFHEYQLEELFSSSASAVLLVKAQNRFFALPFGPAGRHFLRRGVWEERFGLIVTLNSVQENSIRSIDTKTLESGGIQTRIQSSKPTDTDSFGFDTERDLVRSVTGISKDETKYGKSLSGKDSLRVSLKCEIKDIKGFLKNFLDQFHNDDYKTKFSWVDKLKEIHDLSRISTLEEKLLEKVNVDNPDKLWLTVPEILNWEDHGGFRYSRKKEDDLLDDIHIKTFKEYLNESSLTIEHLKNSSVYRFSISNEYQKDHWKIYECLYFEHSEGNETCFLTGGKWYAVDNSLVQTVKDYYNGITKEKFDINFIDYNHENENNYNDALANENDAYCVDADLIKIEGRSKFEFCDVYTKSKQMIHIKKYSRSSVLSHLFNQGYVSGNFLLDKDFREKISNKLEDNFKIEDPASRPNQTFGEYTVIFGIISKSGDELEIPFFSKLTLMHTTKDLINKGFEVSLVKINNVKPDKVITN